MEEISEEFLKVGKLKRSVSRHTVFREI